MQFVYPYFLWALSLIAIPVIVHLFRFRRFKTVYFSNVSFLKEIKQETNKQSQLKHLLVLLSRILAIVFLVFAFAQPFIPVRNHAVQTGKKFVSVYIDNSFSMSATDGAKSLLDEAKSTAREIVKGYAANDKFQLLTNNFSGHEQHLIGKEEFLSLVDEIEISPASRRWNEIQKRQEDALAAENSPNQIGYVISDFQKNMGTLSESDLVQFNLIPLNAKTQSNLVIDSVFFYNPVQLIGQKNQLIVRMKNISDDDVENLRVSLTVNKETKALGNLFLKAHSVAFDTLNFTISQKGWNNATISIADFPITFDDTYFVSYFVPEKLRVLQIKENGSGNFIDAVFQNQPEFELTATNPGNIQYADFEKYQLIIITNIREISSGLSNELTKYLENGGSILFFPNENLNIASVNNFLNSNNAGRFSPLQNDASESLATETSPLNLQHRLLRNIFDKTPQNMILPKVKLYFPFSQGTASAENIITLKNKHALWLSEKVKNGNLYICTSPLDVKANDLAVHSIFAPLVFEMGISGANSLPQSGIIGSKEPIAVEAVNITAESVLKVAGDKTEFIPQQSKFGRKVLLTAGDNIRTSGFYKVFADNSDSVRFIAMNYNRAESDLQFDEPVELETKYPKLNVLSIGGNEAAALAQELGRGSPLWKYCLWIVLLFLAVEIGLLLLWKK